MTSLRRNTRPSPPRSPEEKRLRRLADKQKYRKSPHGRVAERLYAKTPVGRKIQRRKRLKRMYGGLSAVAWDVMFAAQEQCCIGCGGDDPLNRNGWMTHHTGEKENLKVHGILCHPCNIVLNKHMTPEKLRRLADFMDTYYGAATAHDPDIP